MESKRIAIMQPYFFPYFGYFQLIAAVDIYVNLDHVSFMKRSYMTRNKLKNETQFNVQVSKASQNQSCLETMVNFEHGYIKNSLKTLHNLYCKSPFYEAVMDRVVIPEFYERDVSISSFNLGLVKRICNYLKIETKILESSYPLDKGFKFDEGLISITKQLKGEVYVNAIGGQKLYEKSGFAEHGVQLLFHKMGKVDFADPYFSTLHQLFLYPRDHLIKQVDNYELI